MGCISSSPGATITIDFENAQLQANEQSVHDQVMAVFEQSEQIMKLIEDYQGCQELAKLAMQQPSHENEKAAFEGLLGSVDAITSFFNFCKSLERVFSVLLGQLASNASALDTQQALCTLLANILAFMLRFDQTRMMRPNLSNDFSYYRRLLPKFNNHPDIKVADDDASGMAMFTAEHIPVHTCVCKAGAAAIERDGNVGLVLSTLANSCANMIKTKRYSSEATNMLCARAMAGAIVLFDNIDPVGAFHKRSPINVKLCVMVLKREFPDSSSMPLLNSIHYSTKNFNDAPQSVQNLFE